jgi:phage terminase large subunit-like protein
LNVRWGALEREQHLKAFVDEAWQNLKRVVCDFKIAVEVEPGSGGKESAEATARNLAGYTVVLDKVTGDKVTRADPFAAQCQAGNVGLVAGLWVPGF